MMAESIFGLKFWNWRSVMIHAVPEFTFLNRMAIVLICLLVQTMAYDPDDKLLKDILLPEGQFEAFYLKENEDSVARPPHLHGTFHKYKNPALINAPNSAAYGYRFDGKRRFNYD